MIIKLPLAILVASLAATPAFAACTGGETLTIAAKSDSLTMAPTAAATFNVGEHVILSATAVGFVASNYSWTVAGPAIKDYSEDMGTQAATTTASPLFPWSTTNLAPADLLLPTVSLYWKPSPSQIAPLNGGPVTRTVSLTVNKSTGGTCTATANFSVERNTTNSAHQPEDFYTSNHRLNTTTNPLWGHPVDEHVYWHSTVHNGASFPIWTRFLAWHGEFLRRFDQWRVTFGYEKVAPWYPGRALPTGPAFDHTPRIPFNPDANRIPTYYTLTGGGSADPNVSGVFKLSDYSTQALLDGSFEPHFHGDTHCNIGPWDPMGNLGPNFGSMCFTTSLKDPMFWRWHGFIDTVYRNYCHFHPAQCPVPSPADPAADPWMADNPTDITNNGTVPSPGTHWISPDIWNRRSLVATDACVAPIDALGNHVTTGGVVRNCGSDADHENPEAGVTNYLYGTLHNTRPGSPRVVYAEVAVYYALASTGLTYPANFTMVPESRQFLALHLEPGTTTSIGPIPWTPPPVPPANDHYCLYIRVLSVQETPPSEGAGIDADVAASNSLAWRNIKVVPPGDPSPPSFFIVRNIRDGAQRIALQFDVAAAIVKAGGVLHVLPDEALLRAMREGDVKLDGATMEKDGSLTVKGPRALITGFALKPGQQGNVQVRLTGAKAGVAGDITITQRSARGVDGGVTLRVAAPPGKPRAKL